MSTDAFNELKQDANRLFGMLKGLSDFDKTELRGVFECLLSPSIRDGVLITTYLRVTANVESLLFLTRVSDCQAILMLARACFELAVDLALMLRRSDGVMLAYNFREIEILRVSEKTIAYAERHPAENIDITQHKAFISRNGERIRQIKEHLWPDRKRLDHWSGIPLSQRAEELGGLYDRIYMTEYPQLSWHAHAGLAGIMEIREETFVAMAGKAYECASDAYEAVLALMIAEFKIASADEKISQKLRLAKMLSFTNSTEQAFALRDHLLG